MLWDFYCKNRLLCYTREENAIEFKIRGEKRCIFGTGSTNLVCRWCDGKGVEAGQKIVQIRRYRSGIVWKSGQIRFYRCWIRSRHRMQRIRRGKMIRITLEISETIVISGGAGLWLNRIRLNY